MFNPDDFRKSKPDLMKIIKRNLEKGKELVDTISSLNNYGVPYVCIYQYVIEDMPEHTETCKMKIKQLNDFMGVKSVEND